jgi:acylglycerol lipase
MIQHEEGRVAGHRARRLFWQSWRPMTPPRAIFAVAHGFAEHGGRYAAFAARFVERGVAVWALDQWGHGLSGGRRGHVDRFEDHLVDFHAFVVHVRTRSQPRPLFVVGHSLGGLVALRYLARHPGKIAGGIISAPAVGLRVRAARLRGVLARVFSILLPGVTFPIRIDPRRLSRDPAVGRRYGADPLVHRRASARFIVEFARARAALAADAARPRVPLLLLHGTEDHLTDCEATRRLAERLGPIAELHLYPGLYHELFNEPEREQVFTDIEAWMARVAEPSAA